MRRSKKWRNKIRDLENKSVDLENKSFEFNTNFESFKMNYQIQNRSLNSVKERVDEIEDNWDKNEMNIKLLGDLMTSGKIANSGTNQGNSVDHEELEKLTERVNGNDALINGLIGKVKKLTSDNSKVKTPGFSNKDYDKHIEDRIKTLERMVNNIGKSSTNKKSEIALDFDIENRVKLLEKEIDDLKCAVPINTVGSNDGTTHSSINYNLKKKLDSFTKDNQEMKNAFVSYQQMIDGKADFEQLQEIDKVVTDKLNDCIKVVKRQMQEKTESTKNLK